MFSLPSLAGPFTSFNLLMACTLRLIDARAWKNEVFLSSFCIQFTLPRCFQKKKKDSCSNDFFTSSTISLCLKWICLIFLLSWPRSAFFSFVKTLVFPCPIDAIRLGLVVAKPLCFVRHKQTVLSPKHLVGLYHHLELRLQTAFTWLLSSQSPPYSKECIVKSVNENWPVNLWSEWYGAIWTIP